MSYECLAERTTAERRGEPKLVKPHAKFHKCTKCVLSTELPPAPSKLLKR